MTVTSFAQCLPLGHVAPTADAEVTSVRLNNAEQCAWQLIRANVSATRVRAVHWQGRTRTCFFCGTRRLYAPGAGNDVVFARSSDGPGVNGGLTEAEAPNLCGRCGVRVLAENFGRFSGIEAQQFTADVGQALFPRGPDVLTEEVDEQTGLRVKKPSGFIYVRGEPTSKLAHGQLQIRVKEGCIGNSRGSNACGLSWGVRLQQPLRSATLKYRVKFSPGYDWTAGGKLPGLCSVGCPSACCYDAADGWNVRGMWRASLVNVTDASGQTVSRYVDPRLEAYLYTPDRQADAWQGRLCGGDLHSNGTLADGRWHQLAIYIKVNAAGEANGEQVMWIDGKRVGEWSARQYQTSEQQEHLIERFTFRVFHGGSNYTYQPSKDQMQWYDDIELNEGYCPPECDSDIRPPPPPPPPPSAAAAFAASGKCGRDLLQPQSGAMVTFDGLSGNITQERLSSVFGADAIFVNSPENAELRDNALRVTIPAGCEGSPSSDNVGCGTSFAVSLARGGPLPEAVTLSYKLRFQGGLDSVTGVRHPYHFARSGTSKLPGLGSGENPTSCGIAVETGFSARGEWLVTSGVPRYRHTTVIDARGPSGDSGSCSSAIREPEESSGRVELRDGTYSEDFAEIRMYIKLNSIDEKGRAVADGVQMAWFNGVQLPSDAYTVSGRVFRSSGDVKIERFTFQTFLSGSAAPDWDQYQWFDDIRVQEGKCQSGQSEQIEIAL